MDNWATFWAAVAAVAAGLSALFAAIYTRLTYRLVQTQSEPNVIVYVHHDDSRPTILEIVIKNIGNGLAKDIVFQSSRSIPGHAFGVNVAQAKPATDITSGPLIDGIPLLAPGEKRVITWGQFGGLSKALANDYITITCNYSHGARAMQSVSRLEIRSFEGTSANESEPARIIKQLKRIGDATETLTQALKALASRSERDESKEDGDVRAGDLTNAESI
jgi:hypothetical protein